MWKIAPVVALSMLGATTLPHSIGATVQTDGRMVHTYGVASISPISESPDIYIKDSFSPSVPTSPGNNKDYTWNYLRHVGFTAEQSAGIMGNLEQEHRFNTDDVPGGLGIAQWIGNRRDNLIAKENPYSIKTQLDYLMDELRSSENSTLQALYTSYNVEAATVAFQDGFERCGLCMQSQRIQYAYTIYEEYTQ